MLHFADLPDCHLTPHDFLELPLPPHLRNGLVVQLLVRNVALVVLEALPDHGDGQDDDEGDPGCGGVEGTDDGNSLENSNDEKVDVYYSFKLGEKGH